MTKKGQMSRTEGPDGSRSWIIALACCFTNCLLYGISRLSGMLLVASIDTFHVTRARAALPFTISTSVRNLSGAFVGHLGQRLGVRPVVITGGILAFIGSGSCFFAPDIFWITICWGIIFGTGYGLSTCLLPLAINQNFNKHQGTASGISYSGSYIGSFIFPPILVQLLKHYGLSGAFLIISGAMLNVIAAAMLFRKPSWIAGQKQQSMNKSGSSVFTISSSSSSSIDFPRKSSMRLKLFKTNRVNHQKKDAHSLNNYSEGIDFSKIECLNWQNMNFCKEHENLKSEICGTRSSSQKYFNRITLFPRRTLFKGKHKSKCKRFIAKLKHILVKRVLKNYSYNTEVTKIKSTSYTQCIFCPSIVKISTMYNSVNKKSNTKSQLRNDDSRYSISCHVEDLDHLPKLVDNVNSGLRRSQNSIRAVMDKTSASKSHFYISTSGNEVIDDPSFHMSTSQQGGNLLKDLKKCFLGCFQMYSKPMYVVISGTMALHTFIVVCIVTIIEDFAKDIAIPSNLVYIVLMVLSGADLLGTLTLGSIMDRGFITRCHFIVLCFLGMAVSLTVMSFSRSFAMLLSSVAIYGLFESGVIITFPLLIVQYIEIKKQAIAIASSNLLSSPSVLLVPLAMSHFRDNMGSYSGVFYLLGATSIFCSIVWIVAPYIIKRRSEAKMSTKL